MPGVFISHASEDQKQALWLAEGLRNVGIDHFFSPRAIKAGDDWEDQLIEAMERVEIVLILMTARWLDKKWCRAEFYAARLSKKTILIADMTNGRYRNEPSLGRVQSLPLRRGRIEKEEDLEKIIGDIQRASGEETLFPFDPQIRATFPGLYPFDVADAGVFFGRRTEIETIISELGNAPPYGSGKRLTIAFGPSGCGKSSILRAGVVARLRQRRWQWRALDPVTPGSDPAAVINDLANVVAELNVQEEPPLQDRSFLGFRRQTSLRLKPTVLITIDQLEEIFQHPKGLRDSFGYGMRALLEYSHVQILASLRSDFMPLFQEYTELHGLWTGVPIGKFDVRNLRDIVISPARRSGFTVDEKLIAALQDDADTPDALPLVAFALADIWRRANVRSDRNLALVDYRRSGDVAAERRLEQILIERADAALHAIDPEGEHLDDLREAFIPHLVDVRDDGEPVRRRASYDSIPASATRLLEHLAGWEWRLITIDTDERGKRVFEVAHEALLRRWPMLRQAIEEETDNLTLLRSIERESDEWQRAGRTRKDLLRLSGQRLDDAAAIADADLYRGRIEGVLAYIRACETEEHAKVAFVRRVRQDREHAIDWRLHKEIGSLTDSGDAIAAVRLGRQSLKAAVERSWPCTEAQVARSLVAARLTRSLRDGRAGLCCMAVSPDGTQVATGASDGKLRLFELATAKLLWSEHCGGGWVHSVEFAPDNNRVLVGTADGRVALCDVKNGQTVAMHMHADEICHVCFDPNNRFVATAARNGEAHLLSASNLSPIAATPNHYDRVTVCAFSPDGRRLATASWDHRVRLLDPNDPQSAKFLSAHGHIVRGLEFSVNGTYFLSWSADGIAAIYSSVGDLINRIENGPERIPIFRGTFSSNEKMIALVGADGAVRVFSVASKKLIASYKPLDDNLIFARFLLSDTAVLMAGRDGLLEQHLLENLRASQLSANWSIDLKTPIIGIRHFSDQKQVGIFDASGCVNVLDISKSLVAERRVSVMDRLPYDTKPGSLLSFAEKALMRDGLANPVVGGQQVRNETNSTNSGSHLVWPMVKSSASDCYVEAHDSEVHIADLTNRTIRSARLHKDFGGLRSFTVAGNVAAVGFFTNAGGAGLIDLATLELKAYRELDEFPNVAAFLAGGTLLLDSPQRKSISVIDLLTNEVCAEHQIENGRTIMAVASQHHNKAVIGTTAEGVILFDGVSLEFKTILHHVNPSGEAAFSPDGSWLAVATYPSSIEIFRTKPRKGRYIHASIRTHTSALTRALIWSPSSKRIVALFKDGVGRVFTAGQDKSWGIMMFSTGDERLRHITWSANSKQFLVTTDRHARLFDSSTAKELLRWPTLQNQVAAVFDPTTRRPVSWRSSCRLEPLPDEGTAVDSSFTKHTCPEISPIGQHETRAPHQDPSVATVEFSFKGRKLRAKMPNGENVTIAEIDHEAWGEFRKISACWVEKSEGAVDVFRLVGDSWTRINIYRSRVVHADASRDAVLFAVAFPDGTVEIFDLGTGVALFAHPSSHGAVQALKFSAAKSSLIILYDDRFIARINVETLSCRGQDLLELVEDVGVCGDISPAGHVHEFLTLETLDTKSNVGTTDSLKESAGNGE